MKGKLYASLVGIALCLGVGVANAEPVLLSAVQMDTVTAGSGGKHHASSGGKHWKGHGHKHHGKKGHDHEHHGKKGHDGKKGGGAKMVKIGTINKFNVIQVATHHGTNNFVVIQ